MADSIEQKLVARAVAVMALINGTGGYLTTLGSTVVNDASVPSVGDSKPNWDQAELPAVSVFQGPVDIEQRDDEGQKVLRKMTLMFRGSLERGTDASNARKLLADIQRALRAAGDKWIVSNVPLAQYTEEGPHMIEVDDETYEVLGVQQEINIFYIGSHMDLEA